METNWIRNLPSTALIRITIIVEEFFRFFGVSFQKCYFLKQKIGIFQIYTYTYGEIKLTTTKQDKNDEKCCG